MEISTKPKFKSGRKSDQSCTKIVQDRRGKTIVKVSDPKPGQRLFSSMLTGSYVDRREFEMFDHHMNRRKS